MAWRCSGKSNTQLVDNLSAAGIVYSPAVRDALIATDRARYVPVSEADCASTTYEYGPYADAPQALGHKVTVSAPWVHAMALEELAEHLGRPGARALDVGCGSGVLVAAMVRIMSFGMTDTPTDDSGSDARGKGDSDDHSHSMVVGIEYLRDIYEKSIENLFSDGLNPNNARGGNVDRCSGDGGGGGGGNGDGDDDGKALVDADGDDYSRIEIIVRHGNGWAGVPDLAPFDAIHVGAAASQIPPALVAQLAPGGRMIIPIGDRECQMLVRVDKGADGSLTCTDLCKVRFVPLVQDTVATHASGGVDWNERFRKGWAYGKEPSKFLASAAVEHLCNDRPLDILCLFEGQGRNAVHLASLGHRCTVVDASATGLAKACLLAEQRGVQQELLTTIAADLTRWSPPTDSFDVIVSIFGAIDPPARARLHRACVSALRPDGIIIVEAFAPQQAVLRGNRAAGPPAALLVSPSMLLAEFAGFDVLVCEVVEEMLREGSFHRGLAALCRFVARKTTRPIADSIDVDSRASSQSALVRYHAVMDAVFLEQEDLADIAAAREVALVAATAAVSTHESSRSRVNEDWLLKCAPATVRIACWAATSAGVCRWCWVASESCYCQAVHKAAAAMANAVRRVGGGVDAAEALGDENTSPDCPVRIRFVVACHPNEFLRSTSSAKLAVQLLQGSRSVCDGELFVMGADCHGALLEAAVRGPGPTFVLFPGPVKETLTVSEALAAAQHARVSAGIDTLSAEASNVNDGCMTVIVPDGSWECARAVARAITSNGSDGPGLRTVRLDDARVRTHHSPLIEALKRGQGNGRVSTLEAMALFLSEVADADGCGSWGVSPSMGSSLMGGLAPLVEHVKAVSRSGGYDDDDRQHAAVAVQPNADLIHEWAEAIRSAATSSESAVCDALPIGLRRCCLCSETLATPLRMPQHLCGRKHALEVAKRYLSSCQPLHECPVPTAAAAAAVLQEHSTRVLAACSPEPPDVANMMVLDSLAAVGATRHQR